MNAIGQLFDKPAESGWMILHGLRWWVMGFVVLMHVLLLFLFILDGMGAGWGEGWNIQQLVLLGISLLLAVIFLVLDRSPTTELILVVQALVLLVAAYPQGAHPGEICLFNAIWILELSLWLARPALWVWLGSNALLVVLCWHPFPAFGVEVPHPTPLDFITRLLASLLFQLVCFTIRQYIILTGVQRQEIGSLTRSQSGLLNANLDLQNYALEVGERSTIEECKRLTRDIHDEVGYTLINLKMMMEAATDLSSAENIRLRRLLEQAKEELQNGLTETRQALLSFRQIDRVKAEGVRYIHKLIHSFSHATGIEVEVAYGNIPWSFGQDINVVIYRILQESMTNAIRHGRASRIQISFWISDGRLRISVDDNGVGSTDIEPGIGFTGMRERLDPLGGELTLGNGLTGFTVRAEIPWPGE
jgi:signal transduction histidine kinase